MFYQGIQIQSIPYDHSFFNVNLLGNVYTITRGTIRNTTEIEPPPFHRQPSILEHYLTLMGPNCSVQDAGLLEKSMFKNLLAVARWVNRNILGIERTSSFYSQNLDIVESLMTHTEQIDLNIIILQHIIACKLKAKSKLILPVLITKLCRDLLPHEIFDNFGQKKIAREIQSPSYTSCIPIDWAAGIPPEHIPPADSPPAAGSEEEDMAFFNQSPPTTQTGFLSRIFCGLSRINRTQHRHQAENRAAFNNLNARLDRLESRRLDPGADPSEAPESSRRRRR